MTALTACACIVAFVLSMHRLRVTQAASSVLTTARASLAMLADRTLDDDARERAARRASLDLFSGSASMALRACGALGVSAIPVLAADRTGIAAADDVTAFMMRWDVLAGATALFIAGYIAKNRAWRST